MKKNPLKQLFSILLRPDIILIQVLSLLAVVVGNGMALVAPQLGSRIIDDFFSGKSNLSQWTGIAIVLVVGSVLLSFAQSYISTVLSEKIAYYLREKLITKYLDQQYSFIVKIKPSKILTVIGSDVNSLKQIIGQAINTVLTALILLIGSVSLMFSINAKLSIFVILIVPTLLIVIIMVFRKATVLFQKAQKVRDSTNRVIDENIKASMLVRVFVSELTEKQKFAKANELTKEVGVDITKIFSLVMPIIQSTNAIGILLVLLIGGQAVMVGGMTLGQLTAFNTYVTMFTMPILIIGFITSAIGQALTSLGRINEILNAENTFDNGTEKLTEFESLEVNNASLVIEDAKIIDNFSFEIKKKEKIGILGLNGSGKTMLLNLLSRLLDVTDGEVLLNGKNIKEYDIATLRDRVGFAFQENFLLDASISENIDFGRNLSAVKIVKAAEIAEVTEFSAKFPNGLKHEVGERGTTLSGGQKQRIMIARALANSPQLLLLDDVTSMLDVATEQRIMKRIKEEYPEIATLIVSQKIVSIKDCDRIYVIEQGKNESVGTHEKLLTTSKLYEEVELTQRNYSH